MRAGAIELSPANGQTGAGRGLVRQAGDGRVSVLVAGEETGGRFALLETVEARGGEPPRHLHHWEDETVYVLEGELKVCVGGEWATAPAGTAVFLPRGVEHSFVVTTDDARLLVIVVPAGIEGLYCELGGQERGTAPELERLVTAAARYGVEITGPPPSAEG